MLKRTQVPRPSSSVQALETAQLTMPRHLARKTTALRQRYGCGLCTRCSVMCLAGSSTDFFLAHFSAYSEYTHCQHPGARF